MYLNVDIINQFIFSFINYSLLLYITNVINNTLYILLGKK